jgi:hypothetical protein
MAGKRQGTAQCHGTWDEEFNAIFRLIQVEASELEKMVEKNQLDIQHKSGQLFTGIFFPGHWSCALTSGTLAGLAIT